MKLPSFLQIPQIQRIYFSPTPETGYTTSGLLYSFPEKIVESDASIKIDLAGTDREDQLPVIDSHKALLGEKLTHVLGSMAGGYEHDIELADNNLQINGAKPGDREFYDRLAERVQGKVGKFSLLGVEFVSVVDQRDR